MSRGFHVWHSRPLDRVTPPWLANACPPAMSPYANGARHLSLINQWKNKGAGRDGGKRMIQRLNKESGHQENVVLSTWRWRKQGWLGMSQTTDCWPRPQSSLFTFKPQYLNTNSPNWSLYISLKNELREFDKRSKYFLLGDHFINSHNLVSWQCTDIIGRKLMLVTVGT